MLLSRRHAMTAPTESCGDRGSLRVPTNARYTPVDRFANLDGLIFLEISRCRTSPEKTRRSVTERSAIQNGRTTRSDQRVISDAKAHRGTRRTLDGRRPLHLRQAMTVGVGMSYPSRKSESDLSKKHPIKLRYPESRVPTPY